MCQHSLSFVGFFPVSFDIGNVSNKFVSTGNIIHLKMKVKLIALVTESIQLLSKRIFFSPKILQRSKLKLP